MSADGTVLVVDDEAELRDVLAEFLRMSGYEVLLAADGKEALEHFHARHPAVVLTDLRMPRMDGSTLLRMIKRVSPQTQVLVMTAYADLDSAIDAVHDGAFDYLLKPLTLANVDRRIGQALERRRLARERETHLVELEKQVRSAEASLQQSQLRLRALFDGIPDALLIIDRTLTIQTANEAAAVMFGLTAATLVGGNCCRLVCGRDEPRTQCPVVGTFATGQFAFGKMLRKCLGQNRGRRDFEVRSYPIELAPDGSIPTVLEHFRDVTARRRAEKKYRALEAQHKVDETVQVIAGLAAGTAHDFNTLLTIIKGRAQGLLETLPDSDPRRRDVEGIAATVARGTRLVQGLIAFRGTDLGETRPVTVASLIEEMVPTVRSLLGNHITLEVLVRPAPWRVHAATTQIEQLVLNLATNARDAIAAARRQPPGGTVTVEVGNVEVEATGAAIDGPPPGRWVMIAVTDDGCGMTPDVRRRIFEPFFTTKIPGTGTGLGLPTVAWIVKRCAGHLVCESRHGLGSSFRIYLPRDEKT